MTTILPIHPPLQVGKTDDPLHYGRLRWRRFPGLLRLWRPAWGTVPEASRDFSDPTVIYLARPGLGNVETYEPRGTDLLLAFSKIANAEDALAFANRHGFLGTNAATAAVSIGSIPTSEMSFRVDHPPIFPTRGGRKNRNTKAKAGVLTTERESSIRLLLMPDHSSFLRSTAEEIRIYSNPIDLQYHCSIGDAERVLGVMRMYWNTRCEQPGSFRSLNYPWTIRVSGLFAESVHLLLGEVFALNEVWNLWTAIKERNVKALVQMIGPKGRLRKKAFGPRPPFRYLPEDFRALEGRVITDALAIAKEYLVQALNSHLEPPISATLVRVDSNGNLKLHNRPVNLRAALWLQFAELVAGARNVRPCEICGDLMDVTDNTIRKKVHDRCSQKLSMQRYRRKINGEKETPRKR